ncbi:hypothetical protein OPV22_012698 [Ensete ventricosum]|uniref:Uncharacterized protein n=1 Tax=Ensete ventricosum TaxID=4639 RepID=A0AAV8R7L0_ENSVE|nr:hypothetical protein OPV22_012698 [Ensete ventricosum]
MAPRGKLSTVGDGEGKEMRFRGVRKRPWGRRLQQPQRRPGCHWQPPSKPEQHRGILRPRGGLRRRCLPLAVPLPPSLDLGLLYRGGTGGRFPFQSYPTAAPSAQPFFFLDAKSATNNRQLALCTPMIVACFEPPPTVAVQSDSDSSSIVDLHPNYRSSPPQSKTFPLALDLNFPSAGGDRVTRRRVRPFPETSSTALISAKEKKNPLFFSFFFRFMQAMFEKRKQIL